MQYRAFWKAGFSFKSQKHKFLGNIAVLPGLFPRRGLRRFYASKTVVSTEQVKPRPPIQFFTPVPAASLPDVLPLLAG